MPTYEPGSRHSEEGWRNYNEYRLFGLRRSLGFPVLMVTLLTLEIVFKRHLGGFRVGLAIGVDALTFWWMAGSLYAIFQISRHLSESAVWWERRTRLAWLGMCWWAPLGWLTAVGLLVAGIAADRRMLAGITVPIALILSYFVTRAWSRRRDPTDVFSPVRLPTARP